MYPPLFGEQSLIRDARKKEGALRGEDSYRSDQERYRSRGNDAHGVESLVRGKVLRHAQ